MDTIRKKVSYTSAPVYFDDVKAANFLSKITEGFDNGETYETREVRFIVSFEIFYIAISSSIYQSA